MPESKETLSRAPSSRSKPQRSKEENRERAFLAASRRTDRPLKDRYESALRASAIHKQRTGRSLRVTKEMVENDEMYEEVDESLAKEYRRLTADLRAEAAVLSRRLQENYFQAFASQSAQMGSPPNHPLMTPSESPRDSYAWMNSDCTLDNTSTFNSSNMPMLTDDGMTGLFDGISAENFGDEWLMHPTSTDMWNQIAASNGSSTPSSLHSGASTPGANMYTSTPQQLWAINQSPQMGTSMSSYGVPRSDGLDNMQQQWHHRSRSSTSVSLDAQSQLQGHQWSRLGSASSTAAYGENRGQYKYTPNGAASR